MIEMVGTEITQFVVCHNDTNVYHLIDLPNEQHLSSGQPECDIFGTLGEALAFIPEEFRAQYLPAEE
jgi:hypothetical protein